MRPGASTLIDLAAKRTASTSRVLIVGATAAPTILASRRVHTVREDDALALLQAHAADPFDAILAPWPSAYAPLMPFLAAMREALTPEGEALVCDLVWQTAPSPELMRAFAPTSGRERVRPIEGYEMQAEHSGLEIVARDSVDRARWLPDLGPEARAAVEADTRGAARLAVLVLKRSTDE